MEANLARLRRSWNFLRIASVALVGATLFIILLVIPGGWMIPTIPVVVLGVFAAILSVMEWKMGWIWLVLFVQSFLFALGLCAAVLGLTSLESVPALLLAFTMILASEHVLTTALSYSAQYAERGDVSVREFNAETLTVCLNHLYRRLARDSLILGTGFVIALVAATASALAPPSILSDASLYMVIASISLAALVLLKEER